MFFLMCTIYFKLTVFNVSKIKIQFQFKGRPREFKSSKIQLKTCLNLTSKNINI